MQGPIIRITPHEIHVDDPDFIDELFTGPGKRRDKNGMIGGALQGEWNDRLMCILLKSGIAPESTAGTIPHDLHRRRRAAFSSYFSKANIRRLEPVITEALDNLLKRLDGCAKTGNPMPLTYAYKALTSDVITAYCFGQSTGYLTWEDFNSPLFDTVSKFLELSWWMTHVRWLGPMLDSLPVKVQVMLMPSMKSWYDMLQVSYGRELSNRV